MVLGSYFVRDKYGLGHIWRGGAYKRGFMVMQLKLSFLMNDNEKLDIQVSGKHFAPS